MKKKLLSLFCAVIIAVLAVTGLVSCGTGGDSSSGNTTKDRNFVTLSMWVLWEEHDPNDPAVVEIEAAVEEAFNSICTETYSTKVVFNWFSSIEGYKTELDRINGLNQGKVPAPDTSTGDSSEEGTLNDDYPALNANQVDIVLVFDKAMYENLVLDVDETTGAKYCHLTNLDTLLSSTYKNVKNELGQFLQYTKAEGMNGKYANYAVPNPYSVGQYTYLLVNKAAATHFQFTESDFANIEDCLPLIEEVAGSGYNQLAPVLAPFDYYNARFFTPYESERDPETDGIWDITANGKDGLVSVFWNRTANLGMLNDAALSLSLQNSDYKAYLALRNYAEKNAIYATDAEAAYANHEFAVGVVKGDYALRNEYSDYYCIVLDNPRMTDEDLYNGMWAVSAYTVNASRSMEIIAALESNKSLLNTLVYGVKGENYTLNAVEGTVSSNGTYRMNPRYCGNLFYVYPDTAQGQSQQWLADLSVQKTEWLRDIWTDFEYYFNDGVDSEKNPINQYQILYISAPSMNIIQAKSDEIFDVLVGYDAGDDVDSLTAYALAFSAKADALLAEATADNSPTGFNTHKNAMFSGEDISVTPPVAKKHTLAGNIRLWWNNLKEYIN